MSNYSAFPNPFEPQRPKKLLSPVQTTRIGFGGLLILFGLAVGGIIVYQLGKIVFDDAELALVRRLAPTNPDDMAVILGEGEQARRIQLPPRPLVVIGYFLALLALFIAAKITQITLKGGIELLLSLRVEPEPSPDEQDTTPAGSPAESPQRRTAV